MVNSIASSKSAKRSVLCLSLPICGSSFPETLKFSPRGISPGWEPLVYMNRCNVGDYFIEMCIDGARSVYCILVKYVLR